MDFSISSLLAGFIFGIYGIYVFRYGKREASALKILIGLTLMLFPYFISNPWAVWPLGIGLIVVSYRI